MENLFRRYDTIIGNEIEWVTQMFNDVVQLHGKDIGSAGILYQYFDENASYAIRKMQIVYLVNVFDAFMKDFIAYKENLSEEFTDEDVKRKIRDSRDKWEKLESGKKMNISTSFMNIEYALFVLRDKYNFSNDIDDMPDSLIELGSVRNCLVHAAGRIKNIGIGKLPYSTLLKETLKVVNCKDGIIQLNKEFNDQAILGVKSIIARCSVL